MERYPNGELKLPAYPMPAGWMLNPNREVVHNVLVCLGRSFERFGVPYCPCSPTGERSDDTVCPCKNFREGNGCHCRLHVREVEEEVA